MKPSKLSGRECSNSRLDSLESDRDGRASRCSTSFKLIRNLEVRVAVDLEVLFQCVYDYEIDKEMYVRRLERRYDAN